MKWKMWFLLLFLIFTSANYGADMYTVPLNFGRENPPVQFETLSIVPTNLETTHYANGDDSFDVVSLSLNLSVDGNERKTNMCLMYHKWVNRQDANYPLVFENYLLSLGVNEGNFSLIVEKLDFDKFFYPAGEEVVIENLSVSVRPGEHGHDENGAIYGYELCLTAGNNSRDFWFFMTSSRNRRALGSSNNRFKQSKNGELVLDWEGYRITIDRDVRIKVSKIP
jgi:hypothetical protein